jgi:hypothetical protein
MSRVIGKAIVTDEHGRPHDEVSVVLEDDEVRMDGATLMVKFARPLAVTAERPILEIHIDDGAVYRDTRLRKLDGAPRGKETSR